MKNGTKPSTEIEISGSRELSSIGLASRTPQEKRRSNHPEAQSSLSLYLPDGTLHWFSNRSTDPDDTRGAAPKVVGMDCAALPDGSLVELVKDPHDHAALCLLRWRDGKATLGRRIELGHKTLVPPSIDPTLVRVVRWPSGIMPCGDSQELLRAIELRLAEGFDLPDESVNLLSKFILSTWFPDRLPVAPYLWIVGPPESGKTTLLRFLHRVCRRAVLVGDLTAASLYQLTSLLRPTLLIDESDFGKSRMSLDVQRLLRTGNTPEMLTFRNGRPFETYGAKVFASRQLPDDAALASRAILIRMSPTRRKLRPIRPEWLEQVAEEFQAKLLAIRLSNYAKLGTSPEFSSSVEHLTPRMRDLAYALATPLLGNTELEGELVTALKDQDEDARLDRYEEREWLAVGALFAICHDGIRNRMGWWPVIEVLVGGIAGKVNQDLELRGDSRRFSAKAMGKTLGALHIRTKKLGRLGRGIELTPSIRRKIHQLARDYGITRRDLLTNVHGECGGMPCELCIEYDVTGGLKFVEPLQKKLPPPSERRSRRLFEEVDQESAPPV